MPDIRALVKKLIADGESEDVIKAVIKKMDAAEDGSDIKSGLPDMSPELPAKDEYKGPDTWMGGFKKSLFQKAPGSQFSEAMQAGGEGFKGNLESIKDIPANLAYGAKDLLDFHLNPGQTSVRMMESLKQIPDIVKNAGADPRTFGRTLGAFTTAPLATEGLGAGILRGPGAINRIPRVNKTLSSIGNTLEGTRHSNYVPTTPRGLVAGAVRGAVRPVGRAFSRAGERGRLAGSGVESANEAAARTRPNPPPNEKVYAGGGQGAVRHRPVRHDSGPTKVNQNTAFTRPILESAEELAARKRPSVFTGGQSRRNQSTPFEPRPVDTTPYPRPGEIPEGIPGEVPPVRDTTPYERPPVRPEGLSPERSPIPTPDPIPVGEGGLSSRYRYDPFEMGQDPIGELGLPPTRKTRTPVSEPLPPPFNPGNRTPPDLTQPVAPPKVDSPFGQVDPTTGEIIPPLRGKKLQGKWNRPGKSEPDVAPEDFEFGPDEPGVDVDPTGTDVINDSGRQFAEEVQRYPGDEAFDLGEMNPGFRQTSSMPDWGQQAPRPVNPLRPEVPPGQVTNRQMFENSAMRGAETPSPGRQFADSIGHEFDQDMMFAPGELGQPDIPPMMSPVENIFDPRTSGLAPKSDIPEPRTIQPEEWGDWGPDADIPTLVPDANGSHVAAPREGPAEFAGRRGPADTANDYGEDSITLNDESAADRGSRYRTNRAGVSIENRTFIDQLPDEALANFIERQSQNPNYQSEVGRTLLEHASDTLEMRQAGDLVYQPRLGSQQHENMPLRNRVQRTWEDTRQSEPRSFSNGQPHPTTQDAVHDLSLEQIQELVANGTNRDIVPYAEGVLRERMRSQAELGTQGSWDRTSGEPTSFPWETGKTPKGQTLDEFEKPRTGRGRERLNSLFGEERAGKLASGERDVATSADSNVATDRPGGRKRVDDSTRRSWNSFERSELQYAGHDAAKPGLTIVDPVSYYPKRVEMHYRDPTGKPVGILRTNGDGNGIVAFAVDSSLGLGRGKIVFKLLNEAFDRGITEAAGSTSDLTRNLIERVQRLIKDSRSRGTADDVFGNSELELEINKILDGAVDEFNTQPNESMGFSGKQADSGTANDASGIPYDKADYEDWIEQELRSYERDKISGGLQQFGDPEKVVIPEIGMTEADIMDLRAIRHNKSADDVMRGAFPGAKLTDKFTEIFPQYKNAEIDFLSGWNEGAVSVTLKDGRHMTIGREDIQGIDLRSFRSDDNRAIPQRQTRSTASHDRFDKEGNFIPQTGPHPIAAKIAENRAKDPNNHWKNPQLGDPRPITEGIFQEAGHGDIFEGASDQFNRTGPREEQHGFNVNEDPGIANDTGGKLVKKTKEKNFPSVIPEGFEKVGKGRQVGPRGASYTVRDPNGKKLGDINVTPRDIAAHKAANEDLALVYDDQEIATQIYQERLGDLLGKHGFYPDEPKIKIEPKTTRTKDVPLTPRDKPMPATATGPIPEEIPPPAAFHEESGMYPVQTEEGVEFPNDTLAVRPPANAGLSLRRGGTPSEIPIGSEGAESISDFSGSGGAPIKTKPSAFKTTTEVKLNPDVDFGPGGDIKPIMQEVGRLNADKAVDSRYRKLLPEIMRNELGKGETWRGKLERLIYEFQSEWGPEEGAQRLKEMDEFLKSARTAVGREELPTDTPKLTRKLIDATKMKPGKINQQRDPWLSPKTWQDHPNFARRTKAEREKNKK